jgi:hypothetical protein
VTAPVKLPVCAHCGSREIVPEENAEHMCLGFVFDWMENTAGLREPFQAKDIVDFMDAHGIG